MANVKRATNFLPNYSLLKYKILSNSPKLKMKFPESMPQIGEHAFDLGEIDGVHISDTLFCPIQGTLNAHYESVKTEILAWAEKCGFFKEAKDKFKFEKADFSLLGSWCYPDLSRQDLVLSVKWLTFLFYHDDRFDNKKSKESKDISVIKKTNDDLLKILQGNTSVDYLKDNPLGISAKEIADEISARSYDAEFFIERVRQYFDATVMEAELRENPRKQTVEQFLPIRQYVGAVYTTFEMGLIASNIHLTKSVRGELKLIEIARHANNCVCEANDIYSLRKEMAQGSTNLIFIKHETDKLSWEDSVGYVKNLHNDDVKDMLEIERTLPDNLTRISNVIKYIQIMKNWVIGNIMWSQTTGRYNKK